jgi:AraC-like DNA-binding protein
MGRDEGAVASAGGRVSVRIVRPSPDLQSYVTFFYIVTCDGPLTDFLYPEWGNVRFSLAGDWMVRNPGFENETPQTAALFGPTDRHGVVETGGGVVIGFGLTPIGWCRLIGTSAATMANRVAPLSGALGVDGEVLRSELIAASDDHERLDRLETVLRGWLKQRPPARERLLAVDNALRQRPEEVSDFATAVGVSDRTLHRLCLDGFGFAPKRLMRLQRFLDILGDVRSAVGRQVRVSIDDSYYDQSHFYRDFRDFMAMSAREYFSAPRDLMAAAAEAQIRAGVTLSFELPPQPEIA